MSDVVEVKVDWEFVLLDEGQKSPIFSREFRKFPMTLQVDSTTWDEMSAEDREEVVVNDLWERCRTNVARIEE